MLKITTSSLNVPGLINNGKTREVFQKEKIRFASCKNLTVRKSLLREAAEWGYTALFSSLASNKVGVTILLNHNFSFKILRQLCDKQSRLSIVDLEVGDLTVNLCSFMLQKLMILLCLKTWTNKCYLFHLCDEIIIGGDFNLALDVSNDKTLFFFFFSLIFSFVSCFNTVALYCTVAVLYLLVAFYFVPFSIVCVI